MNLYSAPPSGAGIRMIIKPDQFIDAYKAEKMMNPDAKIVLRQYERGIVEAVDHIVELAHGNREDVSSEKDWEVVGEIISLWAKQWPQEYLEFRSSIPDIRSSRNEGGYSESREMMYVGAIPPRLMKLIKAIFPFQQWDKKFLNKFIKRFPLFKVGESLNPRFR